MSRAQACAVSLIWMGLVVAAARGAATTEPAPKLTLGEIAAGVDAARASVHDFAVTFNSVPVKGENLRSYKWPDRTHAKVVIKGELLDCDMVWGPGVSDPAMIFPKKVTYDGHSTIAYAARNPRLIEMQRGLPMIEAAPISNGRSQEADTRGLYYFDLMMLNPSSPGGYGFEDLAATLKSPLAHLRDHLENVDGHACYVVDSIMVPGRADQTVWIDCERGFLPLRRTYWQVQHPTWPLICSSIDRVCEVSKGLWFAEGGHRILFDDADIDSHAVRGTIDTEWQIDVDHTPDGKPLIAVNSAVPAGYFDLRKRLPPGTRLISDREGDFTLAEGDGYTPVAGWVDEPLANTDGTNPVRGEEVDFGAPPAGVVEIPPPTWGALVWGILVVNSIGRRLGLCALGVLLLFVLHWARVRREKSLLRA